MTASVDDSDTSEIGHKELGGFRLASATLATDDDGLVGCATAATARALHECSVGGLADNEQMRRQLALHIHQGVTITQTHIHS